MTAMLSQEERKSLAMHRMIQAKLGSSYAWNEGELYYQGNPLSDNWQTDHEKRTILKAERNWHENVTA